MAETKGTMRKRRQVGAGKMPSSPRRSKMRLTNTKKHNAFTDALNEYIEHDVEKSISTQSRNRPDDNQETFSTASAMHSHGIIDPPYNMYALSKLPNNNSVLKQCIDVMVTNIESNGYRLEYCGPKGKEESNEALSEYNRLKDFFENPNGDYSLIDLRERLRQDYETFGNAYIEVIRDRTGKITRIYQLPAYTMRIAGVHPTSVKVSRPIRRVDGSYTEKTEYKRFRRYAQYINGRYIYFKEFGDGRRLNSETGEFNDAVNNRTEATEVYHLAEYTAGSPYGLPRWFNQLPSIMGSRESELTNLDFFQENAVPAMVVTVAGGYLTDETMESIDDAFTSIRGRAAQNRVLVIEAAGDVEAADEHGRIPAPKVEIKPLHEERQGDALFQKYEEKCMEKIRSSFRLPPIFIGLAQDYNRATADQSMIMAESQIFGPERRKMDDFFNINILPNHKAKYWKFKSLPPRVSGSEEIINTVEGLSDIGAITPNVAINLTNEMLNMDLKPIKEEWGDRPFFLTQAQAQHGMFGDIGIGENRHGGGATVANPDRNDEVKTTKKLARRKRLTSI